MTRTRFWGAQCQLTPSFGNEGFSKDSVFSLRALAAVMNPFTANNLTSNVIWKRRTSIISSDLFLGRSCPQDCVYEFVIGSL